MINNKNAKRKSCAEYMCPKNLNNNLVYRKLSSFVFFDDEIVFKNLCELRRTKALL